MPSWTTAIIDVCIRKHGRDGSLTSFPSSSLVTAIEWPHSFILSGKKILGVAFTSCFSATRPPKSAETTPLLISSLPVSTVPAPRHDFQSTRSPEKDKRQELPKLHFPNYYFSISPQIPQINACISKGHFVTVSFLNTTDPWDCQVEPPVPSGCSASDVWFHSAPYRRRTTPKRTPFASEVF